MARTITRTRAKAVEGVAEALRFYLDDDTCEGGEGEAGVESGCNCRWCCATRALDDLEECWPEGS